MPESERRKEEEIEKKLKTMAQKEQGWEVRFEYLQMPDSDEPLEDNDFKDPYGMTNKAIFKLYSLQTFLYWKLNRCARNKTPNMNLACFAALLSRSLDIANRYRKEQIQQKYTRTYTVYRGLTLSPAELQVFEKLAVNDDLINWSGYNSTSTQRDVAIGFAFPKKLDTERKNVLFEIDLGEGTTLGYCFQMNEPCFTAYPEEKEILLDDGIPFQVTDVAKPVNNDEYLEKYGRDLHIVTMQSKLAKNHVEADCPSTLKTKCSLYEFFKNGNRPPAKGEEDYTALYLSTFMNEAKDVVYGGRYPPKNKNNDNPT